MAATLTIAVTLLTLNLVLFITSATAWCGSCPPTPPKPNPNPNPNPSPSTPRCPRDTLKLGACANVLNLIHDVTVGATPPVKPCCSLLDGLVDLEAALCLCTAIKANVLGINLNVPISLTLLLNVCGNSVPPGFQC